MADEALVADLEALDGVREAVVQDVVDSTNEEVRRRLVAGARSRLVVVADRQTAGRGRRGRTWEDVEGGNVAVSFAVDLPATATLLPLAAAMAVRDTLDGLDLATSIKWPNDVRVVVDDEPRKCAGILVEVVGPVAVVGVGVDLDWRGRPRTDAAVAWTSLAEVLGRPVTRREVVVPLVAHLATWSSLLARRSPLVQSAYRDACDTLGRRVEVHTEQHVLVGRADDLTCTGALVLDVDGREVVVTAGDVVHLRPA